MKTIFRTNDGQEFDTQEAALKHEKTLIDVVTIKADVKELLSQILIKLKDVEAANVESDEDGGYAICNEKSLVDSYLSCVKSVVTLLNNNSGYQAASLLTKYYDSSCY